MSNDNKTNGKGDKPRPTSISSQEYADNWDLAFRKKKPKKPSAYKLAVDKAYKKLQADSKAADKEFNRILEEET